MRRYWFFAAAALAVVLVLVLVALYRPEPQSWTLPDGSRLQWVGVTWGTNQVFRFGRRPIDFLYPLIPKNARTNFSFRVTTISAPRPGALVVWFKRTGIPTNGVGRAQVVRTATFPGSPLPPAAMLSGLFVPYMVSVVGDGGVESRTSSDVRVASMGRTEELNGVVLNSYPRRAESVGIRIHWYTPIRPASSAQGSTLLAEFHVPNRGRDLGAPVWKGTPLPITRATNGLEVSLVKFEIGVTVGDAGRSLGTSAALNSPGSDFNRRTYSRIAFLVRENGVTSTNWAISQLVLRAGSGETHAAPIPPLPPVGAGSLYGQVGSGMFPVPSSRLPQPDAPEITFADSIWLEEPAWRMEAEFTRVAGFPPDELVSIKGLELPAAGVAKSLDLATNIQGAEVKLTAMVWGASGTAARFGARPQPVDIPGNPFAGELNLGVQAHSTIQVRLLEIRDDQGRQATISGTGYRTVSASGAGPVRKLAYSYQFLLAPDAKSVDLRLGVSPKGDFLFYVKPTLAGAGDSPAN